MSSKKINHAFIMAAGRGTRLRPLTKKIPKGLIKFKQTSLIANGIKKLKKYIDFIHISVGYKGPILAKHLIEEKVSSIINTDKKGNSWWIFNSIFKSFDSPLYVLTCDNVTNIDFKKIEKDYFKKGQLKRLDLAFSRDQDYKIYVQDRLRERSEELWRWIERGAHIYVCGDATRMAKDVQDALLAIFEEQGQLSSEQASEFLKQLRRDKRYQRDVY